MQRLAIEQLARLPYQPCQYAAALIESDTVRRMRQGVRQEAWHRLVGRAVARTPSLHIVLENISNLHNAAACCRSIEALGVHHLHIIAPEHAPHAPSDVLRMQQCADAVDRWHALDNGGDLDTHDTMDTTLARIDGSMYSDALHHRSQATGAVRPTRHRSKFERLHVPTAKSAAAWVNVNRWSSVEQCLDNLHNTHRVRHIYASDLSHTSIPLGELPLNDVFDSQQQQQQQQQQQHQHQPARRYFDRPVTPVAFVFGNETNGISDTMCSNATKTFHLPMYGFVQSLNISVAAGMTLYYLESCGLLRAHLTPNTVDITPEAFSDPYSNWLNQTLETWLVRYIPRGELVRKHIKAQQQQQQPDK
jgi:tRNA G18 (ribose-2'-O)-methylase SpoU